MCIHRTPDHQMHPVYPSPQIPVRFFSAVPSHGIQLDLYSPTMVPHDLQAVASDAQGVYGLWFGVDAIQPSDQMVVD